MLFHRLRLPARPVCGAAPSAMASCFGIGPSQLRSSTVCVVTRIFMRTVRPYVHVQFAERICSFLRRSFWNSGQLGAVRVTVWPSFA